MSTLIIAIADELESMNVHIVEKLEEEIKKCQAQDTWGGFQIAVTKKLEKRLVYSGKTFNTINELDINYLNFFEKYTIICSQHDIYENECLLKKIAPKIKQNNTTIRPVHLTMNESDPRWYMQNNFLYFLYKLYKTFRKN